MPILLRNRKIEKFWSWFTENQEEISLVQTGTEPIANKLSYLLNEIDPNITWEMNTGDNIPQELVISADGIKKSFPVVINIVDSAPSDLNWKIIAFRQKTDFESIKFNEKEFSVNSIYFSFLKNKDKYDLDIYIEDYTNEYPNTVVFLFLDSLLGEYVVETKIGEIEIHTLDVRNLDEYIPIKNISDFIK